MLIVEDDVDIRDALVAILEEDGYAAAAVSNGLEALDHLRAEASSKPSLILLDLMMPVMNGHQFRAEQRVDPSLASIPVVVISAGNAVREQAAAMEANGCLKKPIDLDALLETVRRYCG